MQADTQQTRSPHNRPSCNIEEEVLTTFGLDSQSSLRRTSSGLADLGCDSLSYIDKIEKIQKQSTRFITGDYYTKTPGCVTDMLKSMKIPPLQERRKANRLIFFFKVVEGLVPVMPSQDFLTPLTLGLTTLSPRCAYAERRYDPGDLTEAYQAVKELQRCRAIITESPVVGAIKLHLKSQSKQCTDVSSAIPSTSGLQVKRKQPPVEEVVSSDSDDSDIAESDKCIMCKLFYPPCTDTKLSFINIVKWGSQQPGPTRPYGATVIGKERERGREGGREGREGART
ncbi:hypothetical protein DPMN_081612 [Dreissena polymorpha]|uniref:Uncharacterized protein n=1 Tax=Dreissena polymorpha TaxID=45954 RepID=A0A9D3Y5B1_DREPO|nr:hypothetical protein DPMN_081612 [Dreissena polymorpha]